MNKLDEDEDEENTFLTPKIEIQKSTLKRFKGENVKLFCLDYKFVQSDLVEWYKNGAYLKNEKKKILKNQTVKNIFNDYEIDHLGFKDSGVYECLLNKIIIASIELTVESRLVKTDEDDLNKKYETMNEYLFEIFSIISVLAVFVIFVNLISNLIRKKNILDKKKEEKNKLLNIHNYLKLNVEYFEREILNELVRNQSNFDNYQHDDHRQYQREYDSDE